MNFKQRITRLEVALGNPRSEAVLVIGRPGAGGEPLVIGGSQHEYLAALRRLRGEEGGDHREG
jgi:hypothetical protein